MAARKSRKRSTRSKSKAKRRKAPARKKSRSISQGLSLDRKLDILGVALALAGLLSLLGLLSSNPGGLTEYWVGFLSEAFGWGRYLFPLALLIVGLWLVLRHFEKLPRFSTERISGLLLLFLGGLVLLQLLAELGSSAQTVDGRGGGYLGGALTGFLQRGLGGWGMGIALIAWLLIGLALTLDVSVLALFAWVRPAADRLGVWWQARRQRRAQMRTTSAEAHTTQSSPVNQETISPTVPPVQDSSTSELDAGLAASEAGIGEQHWELPPVQDMLDVGVEMAHDAAYDRRRAEVIEETLASFGAPGHVVEINRGPTITQFGVEPDFVETRKGRTRVRVSKIAALADDLALVLSASRVRIQAPVPRKGFVGIEVPNEQIAVVALRDVIESEAFQRLRTPLRIAIGQDVAGNPVAANLAAMPHLLIAGATGSGKSVSVNAIISCLLLHNSPASLRVIMIDPKRVELTGYNGLPHLITPVVVELQKVVGVLQWVTREMDSRYHKFADLGVRDLAGYNQALASQGRPPLPHWVIVVDELADLMMLAPDQTERLITRMAQLARATGIHLVISTQRPSVDVVTGLIKANFPARISFAVASGVDSRVILDQPGAERLLGRGDMLFQAPDAPAPVRLQGVFVSDKEISRIVQYWKGVTGEEIKPPAVNAGASLPDVGLKQVPIWKEMEEQEEVDELYDEAVDLVRRQGRASISMLQRRLRIGYTRAARLIDALEAKGIISPPHGGAHTREILDYGPAAPPAGER